MIQKVITRYVSLSLMIKKNIYFGIFGCSASNKSIFDGALMVVVSITCYSFSHFFKTSCYYASTDVLVLYYNETIKHLLTKTLFPANVVIETQV